MSVFARSTIELASKKNTSPIDSDRVGATSRMPLIASRMSFIFQDSLCRLLVTVLYPHRQLRIKKGLPSYTCMSRCSSSFFSTLHSLVATMRGTLTYISLLLLNATLVRMAPATPGAGTDSSLSLIQIASKVPSSPSDALRFVDLLLRQRTSTMNAS